jgi:hypothetical protein
MQFLYPDTRSASGRFLAHSERLVAPKTGQTVYRLQLIDLHSEAIVDQQEFQDWNRYSQRFDMMRAVILPMK